jgi:hypothetical protein
MQWNELDYEMQMRILDRIGDIILEEDDDEEMQFGIAAAITELEVWSNSPCVVIEAEPEGPYVAQAADPIPEDEHDSFD